MTNTARLCVSFHPVVEGDDLVELRRRADSFASDVALLEQLNDEGWQIVCTGADHGIIDYVAEHDFASLTDAEAAARAAGATGYPLEWRGLVDCVPTEDSPGVVRGAHEQLQLL